MKKKELRNRIENGFSELAPEIFEAVMEAVEEQKLILPGTETAQSPVWTTRQTEQEESIPKSGEHKKRFFWFTGSAKDKFRGYALTACASLALLFVCFYAGLGGEQKAVYLTLDINPSIQIKMDESFQVKQLKGLNQDGEDVVNDIRWKKKEPVQELLDDLIQDVVEKSYLQEDSGILMTLYAKNTDICDELADTLGEKVDQKLLELEMSDVTVAVLKSDRASARLGRAQLESELVDSYGAAAEQIQQMSVSELIVYCQEHTSLELGFLENSNVKSTSSLGNQKDDPSSQESEKEAEPVNEDQKQILEGAGSETSSVKDSEKPGEDDTGKNLSEQKESESRDSQRGGQSDKGGDQNGQKPKEGQNNRKPQNNQTDAKPGENAQGQANGSNGNSTQAGTTEQTNSSAQPPQTNPPQNPTPPSNPADTNNQSGSDDKSGNKDKDTGKDKDKNNNKDKDKNPGKDKDKDNNKDKDKNPGKDKDKDKDKNTDKDKDKDNNKDKDKNPGKDKDKNNNKDKDKNPGKDNNEDKDKNPGKDNNKDQDPVEDKDKDNGNDQENGKDNDKNNDKTESAGKDK